MSVEASRIIGTLYQGSKPQTGRQVADAGFQMLVLCAQEYQPEARRFPGVTVVHAPNNDVFALPITREQLGLAVKAARRVTEAIQAGHRVLVTCMQGRNRSGLVAAIALHMLTGCSGMAAIRKVKERRQRRALSNPHFLACLERLRGSREGDALLGAQ